MFLREVKTYQEDIFVQEGVHNSQSQSQDFGMAVVEPAESAARVASPGDVTVSPAASTTIKGGTTTELGEMAAAAKNPSMLVEFVIENKKQILSGITVALAMIPEAVAFSFVAGVTPPVALTAAWIMCFFTSVFGGRPGMISGATGSMAVIMTSLVKDHGPEFLFYAVMLCGVMQILLGLAGIHRALSLVTFPVKIGFLNGLALVIGKAQLEAFLIPHGELNGEKPDHLEIVDFVLATSHYVKVEKLLVMLLLAFIALGLNFLPERFQSYPLALISIIFVTVLEWAIVRPTGGKTTLVEDMANLKGDFLTLVFSNDDYAMDDKLEGAQGDAIAATVLTAVYLCVIGLTESLMTLQKIDEMLPESPPGDGRREVLAQGAANFICGIFGSMGGCAMIGQAMINVRNGGTKRLAGVTAGIGTLLIMVAIHGVMGIVPVASLVGVMWCVSYHTWEKRTHALFYEAFTGKPWTQKVAVTVVSDGENCDAELPARKPSKDAEAVAGIEVKTISKEALNALEKESKTSSSKKAAEASPLTTGKNTFVEGRPPSKESLGAVSHHSKGSEISTYSAGGTRTLRRRNKGDHHQTHYHHGVAGEKSPSALREEVLSHMDKIVVPPPAYRDRSRLTEEEKEDVELGVAALSRLECGIVVIVTLGTLITNLAIAVAAGVVLSLMETYYRNNYNGEQQGEEGQGGKKEAGTIKAGAEMEKYAERSSPVTDAVVAPLAEDVENGGNR